MQNTKMNLIVSGVARSGTRILAELLNSHEDIVLGLERFKYQFLMHGNFGADLFGKERFFDFRKEDTNLRPAVRPQWCGTYEQIGAKWDHARVVGDTVQDLTPVLRDFIAANPDCRHIHLLRNLKDVALSWQARADHPRASWPLDKGFEAACESWTQQYRILSDLIGDPAVKSRVLLLDYDRMFLPKAGADRAILGFLGLGASDSFSAALADRAAVFAAMPFRKVPKAYAKEYKGVDTSTAQSLRKEAAAQLTTWATCFEPA